MENKELDHLTLQKLIFLLTDFHAYIPTSDDHVFKTTSKNKTQKDYHFKSIFMTNVIKMSPCDFLVSLNQLGYVTTPIMITAAKLFFDVVDQKKLEQEEFHIMSLQLFRTCLFISLNYLEDRKPKISRIARDMSCSAETLIFTQKYIFCEVMGYDLGLLSKKIENFFGFLSVKFYEATMKF